MLSKMTSYTIGNIIMQPNSELDTSSTGLFLHLGEFILSNLNAKGG